MRARDGKIKAMSLNSFKERGGVTNDFDQNNDSFKDGSCSVDRINCSLVIVVNRQRQRDGYQ